VHELKEILIHGHDDHVVALGGGFRCQCSDHVVGFVALGGEDGHTEGLAGGVDQRNLHGQVVGHRRAVGLVVGDHVVAKRATGEIERGGDVFGVMVVDQLPQHRDEDVHGVGRRAGRIAKHAAVGRTNRRVERAVHLRTAVDQIENRFGGHRG
jgi:hypothetical protein